MRDADSDDRNHAPLVRLAQRLALAQAVARGEHKPLPPGHTSARAAQEMFAKAVQLLLEETGVGRFTDLPLTLLEAFGDVDRGRRNTLFEPHGGTSRPPPPLAVSRLQARAAKALDLMLSLPQARRPGIEAGTQAVWKARKDWTGIFKARASIAQLRREIRAGRATRDLLRLWKMPLPAAEFGTTPDAQIAALLALLAEC